MGKVVNKMAFNIKCEKVKNVTNEEDVTRIKAKEEEIVAAEKELKIKIERNRIIESNLRSKSSLIIEESISNESKQRSLLETRLQLDIKTKQKLIEKAEGVKANSQKLVISREIRQYKVDELKRRALFELLWYNKPKLRMLFNLKS